GAAGRGERGGVRRMERPRAMSRDARRNGRIGGIGVERRGERAAVERVVDRAAESDVAEERTPCVEDEIVDEWHRLAEVTLVAGSGGDAPRSVAMVQQTAWSQQRVVVEVAREIVDGPPVSELDRLWCPDVAHVDDSRGA